MVLWAIIIWWLIFAVIFGSVSDEQYEPYDDDNDPSKNN